MAGTVAVLPIYGVLIPRADAMMQMSGGSSVERLQATFHDVVEDENVTAIVLDIDSPGGSSFLIAEFAAAIREARGTKPIVAVANPRAASAAYWLASQADELVVTKSGDVGSIGTFVIHEDISKALDDEGVKITEVASSPEKVEMSPFKPLSEAAEKEIERRVAECQAMFVNDVALGRRVSTTTVLADFGKGRMVSAETAVQVGMADSVGTLEETIQRFSRRKVDAPVQEPEQVEPDDLGAQSTAPNGTANVTANITNLGAGLGPTFASEAHALRDSADRLVTRMASLAEVERGSLTRAKRDALTACPGALREAAQQIDDVLALTDPEKGEEPDDVLELEYAFAGHAARLRQ
jgi:signal peptide peptidase SppA